MPLEPRLKILSIANAPEDTTNIEHENDAHTDDVTKSDAHKSEVPCHHVSNNEVEAAADLGNYQQTPASKEQVDPSGYGPIEEAEQRANDLQSKIKAAQREARATF